MSLPDISWPPELLDAQVRSCLRHAVPLIVTVRWQFSGE